MFKSVLGSGKHCHEDRELSLRNAKSNEPINKDVACVDINGHDSHVDCTLCISNYKGTADVIFSLNRERMGLLCVRPESPCASFSHGPPGFERQAHMIANQVLPKRKVF